MEIKVITYPPLAQFAKYLTLQHVLVLCICLLLVILPSVNMPELYNPTQTGKFIFFGYAMIGISFVFAVQLLIKKEIKFSLSVIDILLFVLFSYIIINRYFIQDIYSFSLRFYELIGLAVLYVVLRSIPRKYYIYFLLAIIIGGIIQAVYGNLQLLGFYNSFNANFKMTGTFFNPGPYAGYLAAIFPLAVGIYLFRNKLAEELPVVKSMPQWLRQILLEYLPLAGVLSILLVLPASRSRAAWLAAGVSSALLLAIKYQFKNHFLRVCNTVYKKAIALSLMVLLTAGSMHGIYLFKQDSADGRLLIWTVSANIIKDYPLFGVGFDRFKAHYMNYQAAYFQDQPESKYTMVADNVQYAFNEVLQSTVENGLLGLVLFIIFVFITGSMLIGQQEIKCYQIIAGACFLSLVLFSLFAYPLQILAFKILALQYLMAITYKDKRIWVVKKRAKPLIFFFRISMVILSFALSIVLIVTLTTWKKTYANWQLASKSYQMGTYQNSTEVFSSIYPLLAKEGEFLQQYGKALSMAGKHGKAIEKLREAQAHLNTTVIQTALGDAYKGVQGYDIAEADYKKASLMTPSRFYPEYLLAKLYDEAGYKEAAVKVARGVLDKAVKVPSLAIEEIKAEMESLLEKYEEVEN